MEKGAKKRAEKIYQLHKHEGPSTFDALTGKLYQPKNGYQVSFFRDEALELDDDSWDKLTAHIMKETNSREYVGITPDWGGETSFYCESLEQAMNIAKKFNQESILDWNALTQGEKEIFILNDFQDDNKKVDYDTIIKEIL